MSPTNKHRDKEPDAVLTPKEAALGAIQAYFDAHGIGGGR